MKSQPVGLIPPEVHEQIRQSLAQASKLKAATQARIREIKAASNCKAKPTQAQKSVRGNAKGVHLG